MSFRITGLPAENFQHLFSLDDAELASLGAVRRDAPGAVPCRVSLTDATPGAALPEEAATDPGASQPTADAAGVAAAAAGRLSLVVGHDPGDRMHAVAERGRVEGEQRERRCDAGIQRPGEGRDEIGTLERG